MSTPARLHKKQPEEPKIIVWINSKAYIIVPVLVFILMILIFCLLCASTGVCAVESGMMRNFINGGMV